ncbi:MAG: hypothetical protein E7028_06390 [Planctomycetaceae bacterium]|nr:hypothetical protein [Planctomycetaceae bacterium]
MEIVSCFEIKNEAQNAAQPPQITSPRPSRARGIMSKLAHESRNQPEKLDARSVPLRLPSANRGKTVYPLNETGLKSRENGLKSSKITSEWPTR